MSSPDAREDNAVEREESEESSLGTETNSSGCSRWRRVAQIMFGEGTQLESRIPYFVFDPDSIFLFYWMGAMALATVYNAWMSALRIAFPEVRQEPIPVCLQYLDVTCDFIYAADIVVQLRTAFLQDGIPVFEPSKIRNYYSRQAYFMQDIISAAPVERIFFLISGIFGQQPEYLCTVCAARLTKLFKFHVLYRFYDLAESRTRIPHFIRVFRLSLTLAVVIHWIACFYYLVSEYEGLGSNNWVYTSDPNQQNFRRKYIICMYWSAMTLTTIGNTNSPETDLTLGFAAILAIPEDTPLPVTEKPFTMFDGTAALSNASLIILGVFVFAMVLGNVGDVISSMNANRQDFQARMDHINMYLTHKRVPPSLQLKIKKWAEYSWSRTKGTDETRLLNILPERLRAEVGVHVHLDNLKKVKIFEQCERGFLCELVLKLRSQVYSPGDYICKVGETGREMFIINHGKVEVLVPNPTTNKDMVVAVLCEGNYFGEISLLRLDGVQNRRTADVRSIGYSELLCLSRRDLMSALVEYPEAKSILEAQAKKRMKTSLQAQRTISVDTLLRSSQEYASFESTIPFKEESRGREVSEIKAMIEELKRINKVPGKTIWQLIARCELLQDKIRDKIREADDSKQKILELERILAEFRFPSTNNTKHEVKKTQKITKQFSHDEGRYLSQQHDLNTRLWVNSQQKKASDQLVTSGTQEKFLQLSGIGKQSTNQRPAEYRDSQSDSLPTFKHTINHLDECLQQNQTDLVHPSLKQGAYQMFKTAEDYGQPSSQNYGKSGSQNYGQSSSQNYEQLSDCRTYEYLVSPICEIAEEDEEENESGRGLLPVYVEGRTSTNVSEYLKRHSQAFSEEDLQLEKTLYDSARLRSKSCSSPDDDDLLNPKFVSIVTHLCESLDDVDEVTEESVSKDDHLLGNCVEAYSDESRRSSIISGSDREQHSNPSSED